MKEHQKRALVYCRVSTPEQARERTSLDTQAQACMERAAKLGYRVERITKEIYTGADLFERPMLAQDRADIRAGRFQALIVHSIDRLSRNIAHLAIVDEECRRADCELIFVLEDLDNSPEGKLLQSVRAYVAEVEREKIKERMIRGRRGMLLSGRPVFQGAKLYGYDPDKVKRTYSINESEAAIVRRVFRLVADGCGGHAAAKRLNAENIPSPQSDLRAGARWSSSTIYRIITNTSYKGEEYQWKLKNNEKGKSVERDRKDWIKLPDGTRPPIVSEQLWEAANATLRTNKGHKTRNHKFPALLRGMIFCAECGCLMHRNYYKKEKRGKVYEYLKYRCGSKWRPFEIECQGEAVELLEVDAWAWREVSKIIADPNLIEKQLEEFERNSQNDERLTKELESARKQLTAIERGLGRLVRTFRNAADFLLEHVEREIEQAGKEKEKLIDRIAEMEFRLSARSHDQTSLKRVRDYCREMAAHLDTLDFDQKRELLESLGVEVRGNGDIWQMTLKIPIIGDQEVIPLQVRSKARL